MVSKTVVIKNESGLHARPASVLAKEAMKCDCDIEILANGKTINPKSLLSIMAAAVKCGTEVEVKVTGETETEELDKIVALIESGLGE